VAPWADDQELIARVRELRGQGERVVWQLPGDEQRHGCERKLVKRNGSWEVEAD
jgi:ATP phosphoribosyltransferase regulatory subunit